MVTKVREESESAPDKEPKFHTRDNSITNSNEVSDLTAENHANAAAPFIHKDPKEKNSMSHDVAAVSVNNFLNSVPEMVRNVRTIVCEFREESEVPSPGLADESGSDLNTDSRFPD